jgi:hypothetical protein
MGSAGCRLPDSASIAQGELRVPMGVVGEVKEVKRVKKVKL